MYRNGSNTHCLPENFINVVVDIDLFFIAWVSVQDIFLGPKNQIPGQGQPQGIAPTNHRLW